MPPPYNQKRRKVLKQLVKSEAPAPADWPIYLITFRGHAESYEEAEIRLKELEEKKYAYSSNAETDAEEKSKGVPELFKSLHAATHKLTLPTLDQVIPSVSGQSTSKNRKKDDPSVDSRESNALSNFDKVFQELLEGNEADDELNSVEDSQNLIGIPGPSGKSKIIGGKAQISIEKDHSISSGPKRKIENGTMNPKPSKKSKSQHDFSLEEDDRTFDSNISNQTTLDKILSVTVKTLVYVKEMHKETKQLSNELNQISQQQQLNLSDYTSVDLCGRKQYRTPIKRYDRF
ncbi:uncharacterized protein LOC127285411 [Leptopilina boulardi]|uniref:uncharacterized protein LOC127285411 n=1 Tax=Leptopilina boulardi TaxID=63433 RepID=UPI0021F50C9F|nr:uncharacterized protein LOC127285411 [Leptopilina boulardi]